MALHELSQKSLESRLKRAREKGGVTKIADGENLYLVVRPNGSASWTLNYSLYGKRKTYSIGTYPAVSLSTARTLAQQAREKVQLGKDPVEARRVERIVTKNQTVSELLYGWMERNKKDWSDTHYDDYEIAMKRDVLPFIGKREAIGITPDDIRSLLERVEKRGANYKLTRVRSLLNRAFEAAYDRGELPGNPIARVKRDGFAQHKERHFPAIIVPEQLGELLRKLDNDEQKLPVIALRLNALVFVRPQNLRFASWEQFDLPNATWTLPAHQMKARKDFLCPLSRQAVEMLENLKTVTGSEGLVFPSPRGGVYGDTTFMKNLHRLGYKEIHSTHGFRTTAKTLLEEGGFDSKVVEKQLAHELESKVERAYNRAEYWQERCLMVQGWADYLDDLRSGSCNYSIQPWEWFAAWRAKRSIPQAPRAAS